MSADQWCTVTGVFADSVGATVWHDYKTERAIGPGGRELLSVTKRTRMAVEPASKYTSFQPSSIPIRWQHRERIGDVVLLDRRQNRFAAVGVLPVPRSFFDGFPDLYWSSTTSDERGGDLTLVELSLTDNPAVEGLAPVEFYDGLPGEAKLYRDGRPATLLEHADEVVRAAHGRVDDVRCRFDDFDRPPSPAFDRRGHAAGDDGVEYFIRPGGPVIAVNGRPPRGMRP